MAWPKTKWKARCGFFKRESTYYEAARSGEVLVCSPGFSRSSTVTSHGAGYVFSRPVRQTPAKAGTTNQERSPVMPFFEHDSLRFHYRDDSSGLPFFFQHGLCIDFAQPFSLFRPLARIRL